jgi:DNA-binding CsgD family transcriptional regulator
LRSRVAPKSVSIPSGIFLSWPRETGYPLRTSTCGRNRKATMSDTLFLVSHRRNVQAPSFVLRQGTNALGRSRKCNLVVSHASISRRHAELRAAGDFVELVDLGSHNGTYVNEDRVHSCRLSPGDRVQFGSVVYRFATSRDGFDELESDSDTQPEICIAAPAIPESLAKRLSPAQREVLIELAGWLSEKQIAAKLKSGAETTHTHVTAIHRALGVRSRGQLLALLLEIAAR